MTEVIRLEDIPVDDIDFTDLEEQYKVDDEFEFDQYIVVTGAPVIPESKIPLLTKALTGLFSKVGKVVNMEFPIDEETKKSKGFLFVECATEQDAKKIIKAYHTKRLDLKHRLYIYTMKDIERNNNIVDENGNKELTFREPELPEFVSNGELKSWLLDEQVRDQYIIQNDKLTTVFWNTKANEVLEENVAESRTNWSTNYVRFSTLGSYLFSYHLQGVTAWGGANFNRLRQFFHPNVRTSAVSPNEKYLVTFSTDAIKLDEMDKYLPPGEESPYTIKNEGHHLCIWDIESGLLCASFPVVKNDNLHWPFVRWSYNDQFCARLVGTNLVVHDATKKFAVVESKNLKVSDVQDFSFAPTGVTMASMRKGDDPLILLAYWTPETNNMSCKATIVEVPRGRVMRTVNLVQVSDVQIHWQNQSEYLCFNVIRHTKSKKTYFSNLEICKLNDQTITVEKIELKNRVASFEWEPCGKRFITISVDETIDMDNIALPRNIVQFWAPERRDVKNATVIKRWVCIKELTKKFSNTICWSPSGRYVVVASLVKPNLRKPSIEFYDLDYAGELNINDTKDDANIMAKLKDVAVPTNCGTITDACWDPSGRFFVVWSSSLKVKSDNGYKMYNVAGQLVRQEAISQFKNFVWRPRPVSKLTNSEKKRVKKNLKDWSAQFEEQDMMEANSATRDLILKQRELLQEWNQYTHTLQNEWAGSLEHEVENDDDFTTVEEIHEEIVSETKEKETAPAAEE